GLPRRVRGAGSRWQPGGGPQVPRPLREAHLAGRRDHVPGHRDGGAGGRRRPSRRLRYLDPESNRREEGRGRGDVRPPVTVQSPSARLRDRYAIAGIGLSRFGKLPGVSAMGFALEASKRAIDDCGIRRDDLDAVLVAMPSSQGEAHGWGSRAAAFLGITPAFCSTMDMGGATAIGMLQTAVALLDAGMCKAVLCAFGTQNAPQGMMPSLFGSPWAIPYGDVGAITFMGHLMRRQMHEHGLESLDYAHIAVTWRKHAMSNPHAQMRKPMTIEDHQASRFINEPMRLFDCCLFTDGGGAFVVTSAERARDLKQVPAFVAGVGQVHSSEIIHPWDAGHGSGREAGERTYAMAGCAPADVDVCQIYDAFTP